MSLKNILHEQIQELGYISYEEMVRICLEEGFKISNGERRLRKSESPNIEPVMKKSKRGTEYIGGYKYIYPYTPTTTTLRDGQIEMFEMS